MEEQIFALFQEYNGLILLAGMWLDAVFAAAPGESLLVAAVIYGGVIHQAMLAIWLLGVLGAWLGALTAFLIGKRIGDFSPHLKKRFAVNPAKIGQIHSLYTRYGIWFLIISRFVPGSRQAAYYLAGITNMSLAKFNLAALLGIIPSVSIAIYIGSIAEGHWDRSIDLLHNYTLAVFLIIISSVISLVVYNKFKRKTAANNPAE